MVGRLGIGNGIGIPFRNKVLGGGGSLPPELKEALCGVWIADQNTNESPTRNIIKNKLPNKGGDFEILNAAYKLNSGYGKYDYDYTDTTDFQLNKLNAVFTSSKVIVLSTIVASMSNIVFTILKACIYKGKIKITGLDSLISKGEVTHMAIASISGNTRITKDGIYDIDSAFDEETLVLLYSSTREVPLSNELIIEQIPSYQGAFCTDGVEDMIVSQKPVSEMLGGSNEITVVSMIHQGSLNSVYNKAFTNYLEVLNGSAYIRNDVVNRDKTGIYGYTSNLNTNTATVINNILGDKSDYFSYSTNVYDSLSNTNFNVVGRISSFKETSSVAWYWTLIAKRVLTTDEINQIIAYYNLDKYVTPDILYDVKRQGITNENHANFGDKLIDYSGNGKDMQLYNLGWEGMSGANGYPVVFGANKTWEKTPSDYIIDYTANKVHITKVKIANNGLLFSYVKESSTIKNIKEIPPFKIKVSGLEGRSKVWYRYLKTENATGSTILVLDNGIHELPKSFAPTDALVGNTWVGFSITPIQDGVLEFDCNITIEVLPEYENAIVLDGVDDYGQYVGDLGLKDYTVIADRAYAKLIDNQVPIVSALKSEETPFIFEYSTDPKIRVQPWSFYIVSTIAKSLDINRKVSYQSTYSYNSNAINKGTGNNPGDGLTFGRYGGNSQYAALCLYSFMLFPYSLSSFLIERQLKKRKLGTLYPNMVEFRPIVKSNIEYSNIDFF